MTVILDTIHGSPGAPGGIASTDFEHRRLEPLPGWLEDLRAAFSWPMPAPEWAAGPAALSPEDVAAVRRAGGF